jgi:hypothetical protein
LVLALNDASYGVFRIAQFLIVESQNWFGEGDISSRAWSMPSYSIYPSDQAKMATSKMEDLPAASSGKFNAKAGGAQS